MSGASTHVRQECRTYTLDGAAKCAGAGHCAGGFPAVFGLFLKGLQEDSLHAFGGVRAEGTQGQGGVLKDHLVGIGLARVEAEIGVLAGQRGKNKVAPAL